MLVDLGRNDVGKIAQIGTVEVTEYQRVHRYSKIMHICSEVQGDIKQEYGAFDAISALLPAGTLSGAPKIRACEIIEELENTPRGVYGGAHWLCRLQRQYGRLHRHPHGGKKQRQGNSTGRRGNRRGQRAGNGIYRKPQQSGRGNRRACPCKRHRPS